MDRAGVWSGVRRGDRRTRACGRGATDSSPGRRRPRAMAATRAKDQGDACHLRARRRGHDIPR